MTERKQVGVIGVDAGICWIGDPCYILHKQAPPKDIGTSWNDFCRVLCEKEDTRHAQFNFDAGHAGLGVVVSTGGDGCYPVYADMKHGRIVRVIVQFETDTT